MSDTLDQSWKELPDHHRHSVSRLAVNYTHTLKARTQVRNWQHRQIRGVLANLNNVAIHIHNPEDRAILQQASQIIYGIIPAMVEEQRQDRERTAAIRKGGLRALYHYMETDDGEHQHPHTRAESRVRDTEKSIWAHEEKDSTF